MKKNIIENHVKNIKKDGFSIIENYVDKKSIIKLNKEADKISDKINQNDISFKSPVGVQSSIKNDRIVNNIIYFSENFLKLATSGYHINIISKFLNDPYYGLISEDLPNFILGGANIRKSDSALLPHVDVRMRLPDNIDYSMQCVLALGNRNQNNGGLLVAPGSHRDVSKNLNYDMIPINLNKGDMIIFFSNLVHATSRNKQEASWGFLLTYKCWWTKPQFDFLNMFGIEKIRKYSEITKTLLGFYSCPSSDPFASASVRTGYNKNKKRCKARKI